MSIGKVLLGIAAVIAVMVVYKLSRPQPPSEAEIRARVAREVDALQAEAARRHPGMPTSEAMQQIADARVTSELARQPDGKQAQTAASYVLGFYLVNTHARPDFCRGEGVEIPTFVSAFERAHAVEWNRARTILREAGVDADAALPLMRAQLVRVVEQDVRDVAKALNATPKDACLAFEQHAQRFATGIVLPAQVKQALMR